MLVDLQNFARLYPAGFFSKFKGYNGFRVELQQSFGEAYPYPSSSTGLREKSVMLRDAVRTVWPGISEPWRIGVTTRLLPLRVWAVLTLGMWYNTHQGAMSGYQPPAVGRKVLKTD